MNAQQARAKAILLWGRFGAAQANPNTGTHFVVVISRDLHMDVKGFGQTWDEAFANAARAERSRPPGP